MIRGATYNNSIGVVRGATYNNSITQTEELAVNKQTEQSKTDEGYQEYLTEKDNKDRLRQQMRRGDKKRYIFTIYVPATVMGNKGLLKTLKERAIEYRYLKRDKHLRIECSLESDVQFFINYFACIKTGYRQYLVAGRYYNGQYFSYGTSEISNSFYFPSYDPTSKHYDPEYIKRKEMLDQMRKEGREAEARLMEMFNL